MAFDLDVDTPEKVPEILRQAAEAYDSSQGELQTAWQDKKAGHVWSKIAIVLENAADKIERYVRKG